MTDTIRTQTDLLSLFAAAQTPGSINSQDMRDTIVTLFNRGRQILLSNVTYYVRTDGNDSNSGLGNDAGSAFLTVNQFINTVTTLELNGYTVTCQLADGTYTVPIVLKDYNSRGSVVIQGNISNASSVIIQTTNADCISATNIQSAYTIQYVKLSTITYGSCIRLDNSVLNINNLNYGTAVTAHNMLTKHSILNCGNFAISGGSAYHWYLDTVSSVYATGITITITNVPTFTVFIYAIHNSMAYLTSLTINGTAAGTRYTAFRNATIFTNGGGPTYLPGNIAGTPVSNGTAANYLTSLYGLYV